ncbi:glycine cleavage system protein R [Achromatium sp. WMS2]|nr:glycine cleavage system protein R [Achromatium sp. WMS2]
MSINTKKIYLALSVLGKDNLGIICNLSKMIADYNCSIEDGRMTVLGGEFAAILLIEGKWNALAKLESALPDFGKQQGLTIVAKRTGEREPPRALVPYAVDVFSLDRPGIIGNLSKFFADHVINIEDIVSSSYVDPRTDTQVCSVHMTVGIPGDVHIASLRDEFMDYCDDLNLDASLEPIKI